MRTLRKDEIELSRELEVQEHVLSDLFPEGTVRALVKMVVRFEVEEFVAANYDHPVEGGAVYVHGVTVEDVQVAEEGGLLISVWPQNFGLLFDRLGRWFNRHLDTDQEFLKEVEQTC